MSQINVLFNVPTWVEVGLKSGELQLFGGVVRDNAGQIVYMLKGGVEQAAKSRNGKIIIGVVVVAALAGGGYYLYKKLNKKEAAKEAGGLLERELAGYLVDASQQEFSLKNIKQLSDEITKFLDACESAGIDPDDVFISKEAATKFKDVYDSLVDFNYRQAQSKELPYEQPKEIDNKSVHILKELKHQLIIQGDFIV